MSGQGFTDHESFDIDLAIRHAEQQTRFEVSVFVGLAGGHARAFAERLHAGLVAPNRSLLVLVDPAAHHAEVVTGTDVRCVIPDAAVKDVLDLMCSTFADGDLVEGIVHGLRAFGRARRGSAA